jgi:hypothetical protein
MQIENAPFLLSIIGEARLTAFSNLVSVDGRETKSLNRLFNIQADHFGPENESFLKAPLTSQTLNQLHGESAETWTEDLRRTCEGLRNRYVVEGSPARHDCVCIRSSAAHRQLLKLSKHATNLLSVRAFNWRRTGKLPRVTPASSAAPSIRNPLETRC